MDTPTAWHRLLGIALTDLFTGRPWRVEVEKEVALKSQRLDLLIIERQAGAAAVADPAARAGLPDGLDGLRGHNLLTYKSRRQPLDQWALDELLGHYVTYRKLVSIDRGRGAAGITGGTAAAPGVRAPPPRRKDRLLPAGDFGLYAVATRTPRRLLARQPADNLTTTPWPGVLDLRWGGRTVRLILLGELARHPRNALWELFSARAERILEGLRDYRPRDRAGGDLLAQLYFTYRMELRDMAYTVEDFDRDFRRMLIRRVRELDPEDLDAILAELSLEERLRGLDPQERLRGLDPAVVEAWLKGRKH